MSNNPDKKRIRELTRALEELLEQLSNHRCPYCGTTQCPVTVARTKLTNAKP